MNTTRGRGIFHRSFRALLAFRAGVAFLVTASPFDAWADEIPKAPVPKSTFVTVVYRYADAMLEQGRDTYGPQKTGLLLSALDRTALAPLTNRPTAPAGVREGGRAGAKERALTGANPQHDENLLRLLYMLSELSGKPKYREAADAELKWFLENAASPATHLLPWGVHMSWDVVKDEPIFGDDSPAGSHEFFRPWLLWDRCFELAPDASKQFALGLWEHQIANHATGAFDRRAGFAKHSVEPGDDIPRHAGFYLRTWSVAYAQTKDEQFLKAIEVLLERFENKRQPKTGLIEMHNLSIASTLSFAIDCDGAAHRVPGPLASRLRAFATREDEIFCALPQDLKTTGGFSEFATAAGAPKGHPTPLWSAGEGVSTTAQIGMMCVSRYENTGKTGYREIIHTVADAYRKSMPGDGEEVWPVTIGHAISLQLAAWRSTAKQVYLDRARALGDFALEKFFDQGPLPRASLSCDHYETITGADTLALALVELHLEILHITAVRYPPNTIDR